MLWHVVACCTAPRDAIQHTENERKTQTKPNTNAANGREMGCNGCKRHTSERCYIGNGNAKRSWVRARDRR